MASLVFCSVFVDFLHFHPAVLEPDLDLPFGEVEQSGHLVPAVPGEVHVEQKLFLQFQGLVFCIGAALFPSGACMKPVGRWVIGIDGGLVSAALILSIVFGEGAFAGLFFSINWRRTTSIVSQGQSVSVKRGTVTPSGRQRFRFNAIRPAGGQAREGERTGRGLQPGAHVPAVWRRRRHGRLGVHVGVVVMVVVHRSGYSVGARRVHRVPRGAEYCRLGLEAARAEVRVLSQRRRLPGGWPRVPGA